MLLDRVWKTFLLSQSIAVKGGVVENAPHAFGHGVAFDQRFRGMLRTVARNASAIGQVEPPSLHDFPESCFRLPAAWAAMLLPGRMSDPKRSPAPSRAFRVSSRVLPVDMGDFG